MQIKHSATILFTYFFGVTSEPSFNVMFSFALVVDSDPQYRQCLEEMSITRLTDGEVEDSDLQENDISHVCKLSDTHRCSCTVLLICVGWEFSK